MPCAGLFWMAREQTGCCSREWACYTISKYDFDLSKILNVVMVII